MFAVNDGQRILLQSIRKNLTVYLLYCSQTLEDVSKSVVSNNIHSVATNVAQMALLLPLCIVNCKI
jgi:hypothetical protein